MFKTFKRFLLIASIGVFAVGVFSQATLEGGRISSDAIAHATAVPSCSVSMAISDTPSDSLPAVGETITYTLTGSSAFTASTTVMVTDQLGAGLTFVSATPSIGTYSSSTGIWNVGTLNGPANISLVITATVDASAAGKTIENEPSINFTQAGCTESPAVAGAFIIVQGSPVPTSTPQYADLAVVKTANVTSTAQGGTVDYRILVTNNGPATSTDVVATDTLPSGLSFVNATASEGSYTSSTGTWTIGTLGASSTATLQVAATVTASAGTPITNTATVGSSASTTDNIPGNNRSSVTVYVTSSTPAPCTLTAAQFEAAVASGTISWSPIATATDTASFTLVNRTSCSAPISLASYKMFVPQGQAQWLSSQQLFDGTSTAVGTSSTATLAVTLPPCAAQVDAYYGSVPYPLLDSNPYHYPNVPFVLAWAFTDPGNLCSASAVGFSISKSVDNTSPSTGDTVHYTVTVGNIGSATSTDVVATDTLPSGLSFVNATASEGSYASSTGTWTIGTLGASSTATLQVAATVTASAGTPITNTATVASDTASVTLTVANGGGPIPTSTIANLSIDKTVDNAAPNPGATINYTLTVNAQGPATSTGVVATDTLPSGLTFENATASAGSYASSSGTWTIGDMSPSSTATLEIAALVNASDTSGMQITNSAFVGESPSSTNTGANTSSSVTVTVTAPGCTSNCGGGAIDAALSVVKTANVTSTLPGGTIDYTITATAGGPNPSTGVVATDTLPSGLTFENATASVGTYDLSKGTWTIGTLAPNATATLEIAALVNATGTASSSITNTVDIGESSTLTNTNPNTSSSVTVAVGMPSSGNEADLAVVKTVDNANPVTGSDVNFTVTVTNNGPDAARFVYVDDPIPSGLAFVNATSSDASATYNMASGVWATLALAPNATATLTMEANVTGAAGTSIVNTATVSSTLASEIDPNPANNSSSVTLDVQGSTPPPGCVGSCGGSGGGGTVYDNIGIVKTVDNANPSAGSTVHYTLTVSNSGPNAGSGVSVNDALPSGLTFVSASASEGSYASSTGTWTIGTVGMGDTATLTIAALVNASDTPGQAITNTGSLAQTGIAVDSDTSNNSSSATITVAGGGNGGGGGGQVLGASTSTGQVLGASCGLYLTSYIHPVRQDLNDPAQVKKLQVFLNQNLGLNLPITGYYGPQTIAAVNKFQVKYYNEVLSPWVPLGLPTKFTPTSYVYQTTQRWINLIMCPALNLPQPQLTVDKGGE